MDTNTSAMTVYAPQLQLFGAIIVGLTSLQCEVKSAVMNALDTGEPISRTMPYTTGPVDDSAWFVTLNHGHDYGRLVAAITCKDDVVQDMIKSALAGEPLLETRDMNNADGGDVLHCTIAGVRQHVADQYTDMFGTVVW